MNYLDLFSGIGGFHLGILQAGVKIDKCYFSEIDQFATKLYQKRFPTAIPLGDIKNIKGAELGTIDFITGGFPCQPFSVAGKRRGTQDDRYLWPETIGIIREAKPTWCLLENVRGLLTINEGMVFEEVCLDLERAGYETQTFLIPACAVNAPHRRDRVWILAYSGHRDGQRIKDKREPNRQIPGAEDAFKHKRPDSNDRKGITLDSLSNQHRGRGAQIRETESIPREHRQTLCSGWISGANKVASDTIGNGYKKRHQETRGTLREGEQGRMRQSAGENSFFTNPDIRRQEKQEQQTTRGKQYSGNVTNTKSSRQQGGLNRQRKVEFWGSGAGADWLEAATELCGVDDGLPARMDGFELSKSRHRVERLKSLGNSVVVPLVAEIFRMIKEVDYQ